MATEGVGGLTNFIQLSIRIEFISKFIILSSVDFWFMSSWILDSDQSYRAPLFVCFIFFLYIFYFRSRISWPHPHRRRLAGLAGIIITKRKWIHFGLHSRIHLFHLHTMFTVRFVLSRQTSNLIIQSLALADIELFNGCSGAVAVRASDLIKRLWVRLPACAQSITWVNSAFHPSGVGKSSTGLAGWS